MNAMEAYSAAERAYRTLYWGTPKELTWTFLALVEILQTTGRWPDNRQLAEVLYTWSILANTKKCLKRLELMDFINIRERTVCFPITPLPPKALSSYRDIVLLAQTEPHPLQLLAPLYGLTTRFITSSEKETISLLNILEHQELIALSWQENQEAVLIHLLPSAELAFFIGLDRSTEKKFKFIFNDKLAHAVANLA